MPQVLPDGIGARILAAEAERVERIRLAMIEASHAGVVLLQKKTPKDLGDARRGILALPGRTEQEVARIDCTAPHFVYLERGARPHMPPFGPIFQWVLRHLSYFGIKKAKMGRAGILKLKAAARLSVFQRIVRWVRVGVTGSPVTERQAAAEQRAEQRRLATNARRIDRFQQRQAERVRRYGEALANMEDEAADVANAIRWSIRKHGQKPRWIVRSSLPQLSAITRRLVAARQRKR